VYRLERPELSLLQTRPGGVPPRFGIDRCVESLAEGVAGRFESAALRLICTVQGEKFRTDSSDFEDRRRPAADVVLSLQIGLDCARVDD